MDAPPDAPAPSCPLKRVHSGFATLAPANDIVTVPVEALDMARSFLVFGATTSGSAPATNQLAGQIVSPTQLRFSRIGGSLVPATVHYYVAEFEACVRVQRGTRLVQNSNVAVNLDEPIDLTRSFPLLSFRTAGQFYSVNDSWRAKLESPTTLRLDGEGSQQGAVEWQVVSFDTATVRSGDVVLEGMESTKAVPVQPGLDPSTTWLLFSYHVAAISTANATDSRHLMVTGTLGTDNLQFEREGWEGYAFLTWYAVSFSHGAAVWPGSSALKAGQANQLAALPGIDRTRSIVTAGGLFHRGGRTPASMDNVSVATASFELLDQNSMPVMSLTRGSTVAPATFNWFAVQFP